VSLQLKLVEHFIYIVTYIRGSVTNNNGFRIGWLDLLTLIHLQSLGLQAITALSLFYVRSVRRCTRPSILVFTSHILAMDLSQCHCQFRKLDLFRLLFCRLTAAELSIKFSNLISLAQVKVQVKVTLLLTVSESVSLGIEPHLGLMTRCLLLFDSYGLVFLWRPL
jgi:hypothetical protein